MVCGEVEQGFRVWSGIGMDHLEGYEERQHKQRLHHTIPHQNLSEMVRFSLLLRGVQVFFTHVMHQRSDESIK